MSERTIGDNVKLDSKSRRKFAKIIGTAGAGYIGMKKGLRKVIGAPKHGVDLVQTLDGKGRPDNIKTIPRERYRRIKMFKNMKMERLNFEHSGEVTLRRDSNDPNSLVLHIYFDKLDNNTKKNIPNEINGIPITYEKRQTKEETLSWAETCDDKNDTLYTGSLVGNEENGTLTCCAKDPYGQEILVTAKHVAANDSNDDPCDAGPPQNLYHPPKGCNNHERADAGIRHIEGDIVTYYLDPDHFDASIGGSLGAENINGRWTFEGLTDYFDASGTLDTEAYGARSGLTNPKVNDTSRKSDNCIEYRAATKDQKLKTGDSGAAVVDEERYNGKLVMMVNAKTSTTFGGSWNYGHVGEIVLDNLYI